ncbi:MAG: hypothetical protein WDO56_05935 [Gammaproteobacteria bacterium]
MKTLEQLRAEDRHINGVLAAGSEQVLRKLPGVVHVSVGLKETNGRFVRDLLCIRVYVRQKKNLAELAPEHRVPPHLQGIATDVNVVAAFDFQADNTRYRPIKGGIQISNGIVAAGATATDPPQVITGTLGCVAIDNTNKDEVLLGNWHVLAGNTGGAGDRLYQPAPLWLPALAPAQLPFKPKAETDKIAVVGRSVISDKVDAAIARIDVSSCCHCCGIHFSNEINGLSVAGKPAFNTIVGDEPAVGGMAVFKVGASTLRTEGVVVEPNYPTFAVQHLGTPRSFTGQIAIQHTDHARQFSDMGDSGAVVVSPANKIVGLVFAGGKNIDVHGTPQPFVTMANHISDVLSALNIRIPYSAKVNVTAGETLADVPPSIREARVPEPYRVLRERLQRGERTALLFAIGQRHSDEITRLINHCRPVMVAWHRCQGPALLATLMGAVRDGHYRLPAQVRGVALHEAMERMRAVLSQHGSAELRQSLTQPEADAVIEAYRGCTDLNEAIERLAMGSARGAAS